VASRSSHHRKTADLKRFNGGDVVVVLEGRTIEENDEDYNGVEGGKRVLSVR